MAESDDHHAMQIDLQDESSDSEILSKKLKLSSCLDVPIHHSISKSSVSVHLSNFHPHLPPILNHHHHGLFVLDSPSIHHHGVSAIKYSQTHHRNRSLDSALQRIPEVDSPSSVIPTASGDRVFKVPQLKCSQSFNCNRPVNRIEVVSIPTPAPPPPSTSEITKERLDRNSLGSDDSGICNSDDSERTSAQSSEKLIEQNSEMDCEPSVSQMKHSITMPSVDTIEVSMESDVVEDPDNQQTKSSEYKTKCSSNLPAPARESWLLRLFESKLFDMSIAITYLFNSKEPGVQTYIGNRMFSFTERDVDFYLPQLVTMYIHMTDMSECIYPYIVHRCQNSPDFSLQTAWLLDAYSSDAPLPTRKKSQGTKLKNLILSEEIRPRYSRMFSKSDHCRSVLGNNLSPRRIIPIAPVLSL